MNRADVLVYVDWDADGDYDSAAEDVTSRVRNMPAISMVRGRDKIRQLSPPMAGDLTFVLDNQSGDYSPENGASPLAGNLLPGRSVRVWATMLRADFDTDGAGIGPPDVFTNAFSVAGTWTRSGGAVSTAATTGSIVALSTSAVDARWKSRMKGIINSATDYAAPYLMFRRLSANEHLYVRLLNGVVDLRKVDGGVDSSLASAATTTTDDTYYTVLVEAYVNAIKVYVDGTLKVSHTLAAGDTKYAGATYVDFGMRAKRLGTPASNTVSFDSFYVYTPQATCLTDDFIPHPESDQRSVEVSCLGTLALLASNDPTQAGISTALYQLITIDVALGHLLDAVGLTDTTMRVFDTGKTTLIWWWLQNEDPFRAMAALLATEGPGAAIYEDGWGRIVFKNRYHRMTEARCTTSQVTISDTGSEPLLSEPMNYNPALKDIINVATIDYVLRTKAGAVSVVWSLGATLTLGPDEVRQIVAQNDDPFTEAVTPVGATDYTVTAGAVYSMETTRTSGQSVTIVINAGPSGVTMTGLQLRAKLVPITTKTLVTNSCDTSVSKGRYGIRSYPLAVRPEISLTTARDFCNVIASLYQEPRPTVIATLNNGAAERLGHGLSREISDRVTIVAANISMNADCFIERIGQEVSDGARRHGVQFGCEKATASVSYMTWSTGLWGSERWGY